MILQANSVIFIIRLNIRPGSDTPRPYRLGQRQAAVDGTRARILAAARDLLAAEAGVSAFTVDAIAEQAGVARMTVYYQFESKRGLLEALFDHFASRGLVQPLRAAFERSEPLEALDAFVAAFCGFWASDRVALRRIRALRPWTRKSNRVFGRGISDDSMGCESFWGECRASTASPDRSTRPSTSCTR